jgi:hypothetical protein
MSNEHWKAERGVCQDSAHSSTGKVSSTVRRRSKLIHQFLTRYAMQFGWMEVTNSEGLFELLAVHAKRGQENPFPPPTQARDVNPRTSWALHPPLTSTSLTRKKAPSKTNEIFRAGRHEYP